MNSLPPIIAAARRLLDQGDRSVQSRIWVAPLAGWLAGWPQVPLTKLGVPLRVFANEPFRWEATQCVFCLPPLDAIDDAPRETRLLASSRLGRWNQRADLAVAVRSWLVQNAQERFDLVTATGMTCRDLSFYSSYWFHRNCWEWIPPKTHCLRHWTDVLQRHFRQPPPSHHGQLWVSPEQTAANVPASETPTADHLAFATANQIQVLALRSGGATWKLTQAVLSPTASQASNRVQRVQILIPSSHRNSAAPTQHADANHHTAVEAGQSPEMRSQRKAALSMMDLGAVGWYFSDGANTTPDEPTPPKPHLLAAISAFLPGDADGFLSHHTRGQDQPWPEEDAASYWWRWLVQTSTATPPALETLLRILCQRRIRAGRQLIPEQQPVVCLSARCPLQSFQQRTFRPHLRRWDYEPYGIAISHHWLLAQGARAVEYLESGKANRWWEQIRYSRKGTQAPIDWSSEQEYRISRDVELNHVPQEALFVFVPSPEEALQIAGFVNCRVKFFKQESHSP